jgi:ribonuclease Z
VSDVGIPTLRRGSAPPELEWRWGDITLVGTSLAARATAFAVGELGVALDIGRMTPLLAAQPVVLLSHGHLDHLSGVLAYLNVRARFHTDEPTRLVVPREIRDAMRGALELLPGMESVRKRLDLSDAVVGAAPGDRVELRGGHAVAFACDHGVPALGWRLFQGDSDRAVLTYAGDGSTAPFEAEPALLDAGMAVVECTFAEPNRRIAARLSRHAHLRDWIELAPRLRCDHLVLAHLPALPPDRLRGLLAPLAAAFSGTLVAWVPRRLPPRRS